MDLTTRIDGTPATELFRLDGRVALISGAAGHLGRAMAWAIAEAGAHVVLNGRRPEPLVGLEADLKNAGLLATALPFDVTSAAAAAQALQHVGQRFGRLDVLVNNAYGGPTGSLEQARVEEFVRAYEVAVVAAFRLMLLARPLMVRAVEATGHAGVINIASMYATVSPDPSIYGESGMNNPPFYGAAKAALLQLTRYAACHWASSGIRVNAISPGPFPRHDFLGSHPDFHRELMRRTPMGRVGHASELKGAILFLASDASSYVTGVNLPVDGGWTAW